MRCNKKKALDADVVLYVEWIWMESTGVLYEEWIWMESTGVLYEDWIWMESSAAEKNQLTRVNLQAQ
jgi:hypothetical protein